MFLFQINFSRCALLLFPFLFGADRFDVGPASDRLRRVSPIAVRPGEGPFTERAAGVRPVHREQVLIRLEAEHFSRR